MLSIDALRLERRRKKTVEARKSIDRHAYFRGVAEARFVLRKVFRLVEEEARKAGIDPLAHQALIQIYGSPNATLRIRELAQRLDIAPSFSSGLVKLLVGMGLVERRRDVTDQRVAWLSVTASGRRKLHKIDDGVQRQVAYFTDALTSSDREAALSILLFYVGVSLRSTHQEID
jgi:DNA-binding MarR family transcriptional regulator